MLRTLRNKVALGLNVGSYPPAVLLHSVWSLKRPDVELERPQEMHRNEQGKLSPRDDESVHATPDTYA